MAQLTSRPKNWVMTDPEAVVDLNGLLGLLGLDNFVDLELMRRTSQIPRSLRAREQPEKPKNRGL